MNFVTDRFYKIFNDFYYKTGIRSMLVLAPRVSGKTAWIMNTLRRHFDSDACVLFSTYSLMRSASREYSDISDKFYYRSEDASMRNLVFADEVLFRSSLDDLDIFKYRSNPVRLFAVSSPNHSLHTVRMSHVFDLILNVEDDIPMPIKIELDEENFVI